MRNISGIAALSVSMMAPRVSWGEERGYELFRFEPQPQNTPSIGAKGYWPVKGPPNRVHGIHGQIVAKREPVHESQIAKPFRIASEKIPVIKKRVGKVIEEAERQAHIAKEKELARLAKPKAAAKRLGKRVGQIARGEETPAEREAREAIIRAAAAGGAFTGATFPNPFVEPGRCVLGSSATHSWLCDPDHTLTKDQQALIEAHLTKIRDTTEHTCPDGRNRPFQVAVAIANSIIIPANQTARDTANRIADEILKKWGIGAKECHDGILLFFVKDRNIVQIATREGVDSAHLSENFKYYMRYRINMNYLTNQDTGRALLAGLALMENELPGRTQGYRLMTQVLLTLATIYTITVILSYFVLTRALKKKYQTLEQTPVE